MAVADKLVRVIFAILRDGRVYDPHHDQKIKEVFDSTGEVCLSLPMPLGVARRDDLQGVSPVSF